ncbi:MAG: prepilin-type N-terminal cleavage/methylation domain-containing protein [Sedimentisphaerales bacterium]|nr:prepilin-type N-terminal cleavage/methylation domain-containing protein [Sedimentisphaerales bacterium]
MRTRKSGFTLVEILIVVIILGILAAIVIPQFTEASNDARESSLVSNLQTLQSQFELYKVQHLDVYPWNDGDDGLDESANIITRLTTVTNQAGGEWADGDGPRLGPYMQEVPLNPFVTNETAVFAEDAGDDVDWAINVATGAITSGYELAEEVEE